MSGNIVIFIVLIVFQLTKIMSTQKHLNKFDTKVQDIEIADYMAANGYFPEAPSLPQITIKKDTNDDVSYILSKLSDEELIKLLHDEPTKNTYDLNDVVRIALGEKSIANKKITLPSEDKKEKVDIRNNIKKIIKSSSAISETEKAFHKLDNREIIPQHQKNKASFLAMKKLHSLLYNRSPLKLEEENLTDEKKELLFEILVAQLKTLCCKSQFKANIPKNTIFEKKTLKYHDETQLKNSDKNKEFIFLILNDEIKSNDDNDDLVIVNPDTLEKNSSVLILGPVTAPLTDGQLKIVINRISNELSKPEYATLLQQLSDGTLSKNNFNVMNNFIYGPETRRYIKAHRCNHQSKLAKIYGGPKWLICTGYLNINTPSLYD